MFEVMRGYDRRNMGGKGIKEGVALDCCQEVAEVGVVWIGVREGAVEDGWGGRGKTRIADKR